MIKKQKLSRWAKENGYTYNGAYSFIVRRNGLPYERLKTGTIFVLIEEPDKAISKGVALYSRVSSSQNKSNLEAQQKRLEDYAAAKGYQISNNVTEIGSGLNDQRPKLQKLLASNDWEVLIVEHKDRLTRFGFAYLETLLARTNQRIEVINVSEDKQDLMDDFVSVITSFCARLYGQRRTKRATERLIKELNE